jgi:hypothetical protein
MFKVWAFFSFALIAGLNFAGAMNQIVHPAEYNSALILLVSYALAAFSTIMAVDVWYDIFEDSRVQQLD